MDVVTSGVSTVVTLFGQGWTLISENPLAMVFVGGSLVGMIFGIFKKMKKSV